MKFCTSISIVLISFTGLSFAQTSVVPNQIRAENVIDRINNASLITPGDLILGIPRPAGNKIGEVFLTPYRNISSIELVGSEKPIIGYAVKYNLTAKGLEIFAKNGVKFIECPRVRKLVWIDSLTKQPKHFLNPRELQSNTNPEQLLELIVDGAFKLFKSTTATIRTPDYIPALDMGSRNERVFRKDHYYISMPARLIEVESRSAMFENFKEKTGLKEFVKKNHLKTDSEVDLIRIVDWLNAN